MVSLDGKVAVVTGSGRGLGRAYAHALAKAGAAVVVNDVDIDVAERTRDEIEAGGGRAVDEVQPVGSADAAERLVGRAVESFGRLDVMCTNAGLLRDRTLRNMTDDEFDLVVATHLRRTFTCARAAAARFREQGGGGRLTLVGSVAGQRGSFGQTNSAAKAGIACLARTWSLELARDGIAVNAVSGQCIGAGGDKLALWSHPTEIVSSFRDGGWDATAIAETWPSTFAEHLQSVGVTPPAAPEVAT